MPYIEPRCDQNGEITHYRINVSAGVNYKGQPIKHRTTWRPKPGMSRSQAEREVKAFAYKFEEDIHNGYQYDDNKTFAQYAEYVLDLKARNGLAPSTLDRYNSMLPRVNEAIGHIKLNKIRPQHLNDFYQNLMEHGVRDDNVRAIAKHSLGRRFKEEHIWNADSPSAVAPSIVTVSSALQ